MNNQNERFYRKLKFIAVGSFCIGLGLFVVSKVLASHGSKDLRESHAQSMRSYEILVQSNDLELQLQSIQNHSRGYILTGDSAFKNAHFRYVEKADESFAQLSSYINKGASPDSSIQSLGILIEKLKTHTTELIVWKDSGQNERIEKAVSSLKGKRLMDALMLQTTLIQEREQLSLNSRIQHSKKVRTILDQLGLASSILASAFLLVSFLFIYSSLRKKERQDKQEADFRSPEYNSELTLQSPMQINYDRLLESSMGDTRFMKEMLRGYLDHVPMLIDEMEKCLLPEGEEELRSIAHKLRSAAQVLEIVGVGAELERIEFFPRTGKDPEELKVVQVKVCQIFRTAFPIIEEKLRQM